MYIFRKFARSIPQDGVNGGKMVYKKKKSSYSIFQNIAYIVKVTWKNDKLIFLYFGLFTVLSAIKPFIIILFPKYILQELITQKRVKILVMRLAGFFLSASFVNFFTIYIRGICFPRMSKIRYKFLDLQYKKCMTTDFQNTEDTEFLNDMQTATRCLKRSDTGIEGLLHKLFGFVGNMLALFGYMAIITKLNAFILIYLIVNVIVSYIITISAKKYEHDKKDDISDNERKSSYLYNVMYDFSYGKELRLFGITDWIANMFKLYKEKQVNIYKQIRWYYFKTGLIDILLLLFREGLIYAYLIYLVLNNKLTIPNFTMYFATIAGFADWFTMMINDIAHMRAQNLDICDFRSFIEKQDSMQDSWEMPIPSPPYDFEFKNVCFKYPNSENYIYKNLNLKIPSGQKLAIVGCNGAGKTTFIKLLCRLYDVTDGEILLNGVNIKKFKKDEYYKLFSTVFQEVKNLAFSVAENVAADEEKQIDYEKVKESLEEAGIYEKISCLKNGMNTAMQKIIDGEGIEFSGGENQKVSIARALYKNGDVMVLDEPTAALDALAEYNIYMNFNKIVKNKTAVYISHRLASTQFCDKIAMFEQGKLVEYGTHDELIILGQKYYDMFSVQAKYYKEEEIKV